MWAAVRNVVVVAAIYYLIPLEGDQAVWLITARVACLIGGIVFVVWEVWKALRDVQRTGGDEVRVGALIVGATIGVTLFALADYAVARLGHGEFVGLDTRTDALYFAVATLATVGFGDVHPAGQLARGLVLVQMVFNVVVLAAAFSLLRTVAAHRRQSNP